MGEFGGPPMLEKGLEGGETRQRTARGQREQHGDRRDRGEGGDGA